MTARESFGDPRSRSRRARRTRRHARRQARSRRRLEVAVERWAALTAADHAAGITPVPTIHTRNRAGVRVDVTLRLDVERSDP